MHPGRNYFKAIVKSEDDRYLSEGYAKISLKDKYVEFTGPFVPSMFLGTVVKIVRLVEGDKEAECFVGTVYLSSKTLLRIINVQEELLAAVEVQSLQDTSLTGFVTPIVNHNGMIKFVAEKVLQIEIKIFALSLKKIRFFSTMYFDVDEILQVSISEPLAVKKLVVQVKEQLLFGEETTGYRCDILSIPDNAREQIVQYLSQADILDPSENEM